MRKILLYLSFVCLSFHTFSKDVKDNFNKNIIGTWSCSTSYKDEAGFEFIDQFKETFFQDCSVKVSGDVQYFDSLEKAKVKYKYNAKWKNENNELIFTDFTTQHYEVDNKKFEVEHELKPLFEFSAQDIEIASIKRLTSKNLDYQLQTEDEEYYKIQCNR